MTRTIDVTNDQTLEVAIIGAGVVGLCCALFLQEAGAAVTIIDDSASQQRASFGHAGVFGVPYCLPAATPAALRSLPHMIGDRNHPFVLRLRALPQLIPWFLQFRQSSLPAVVARNIDAAAAIQRRAREDWDHLLGLAEASHLVRWAGMLEVCETPATLAGMRAGWGIIREHGFAVEELSGPEVLAMEPALAPNVAGGAILADAGHTLDPLQLTEALQARFIRGGGTVVHDHARSIATTNGKNCRIFGDSAAYTARQVIIAAGAKSASLAKPLGNRVAQAAERGYHLMFNNPGVQLRRPVTLVDRKVVMSSMTYGLRMTTMAEFTTPDAAADYARADRVFQPALPLLPNLRGSVSSRWVGSRPSTPDSLPVIAKSPLSPSVFFAFGHGSRGLTVAATTGRLIAALLQGYEAPIDMRPFRADRF